MLFWLLRLLVMLLTVLGLPLPARFLNIVHTPCSHLNGTSWLLLGT
jgi:hypothetical protein